MKSRPALEWVTSYDNIHQELSVKGFKPKLQSLDNESSTALKNYFTVNNIAYQLVPPYCHRRNAAERAIRTFKEHFVAVLSSVDPSFPMHLWDRLLPQAEITRRALPWAGGLKQNSFCSARMQNHRTRETKKSVNLGSSRAAWIFTWSRHASLPVSKYIHLNNG
jgi:hypothetical protein